MAQRWRTAIDRVSFGQALMRLLTALVRVRVRMRGCGVLRIGVGGGLLEEDRPL